jgi:hypothetical protein
MGSADARLTVRGPDGQRATLAVHAKRALQPRGVIELRIRRKDAEVDDPVVVVAPYLSPAVRQRLAELGMGFLDLTGNIRITLRSPALFIDASGEPGRFRNRSSCRCASLGGLCGER